MAGLSVSISESQMEELKTRARDGRYDTVASYVRYVLGFPPVVRGAPSSKRKKMHQPAMFGAEVLAPDDAATLRAEVAHLRAELETLKKKSA